MTSAGMRAIGGDEETSRTRRATPMFTDEQMLEIRLNTATPCHFLAGPARHHRDKALIARRCGAMRSDMSLRPGKPSQDPVS
jgi:hypothetical protein